MEYQSDEQDCVDEAHGSITQGQSQFFEGVRSETFPLATLSIPEPVQLLNREQEARAAALHQARSIMETRSTLGGRNAPNTEVLVRLANYILTGEYVDDVRSV